MSDEVGHSYIVCPDLKKGKAKETEQMRPGKSLEKSTSEKKDYVNVMREKKVIILKTNKHYHYSPEFLTDSVRICKKLRTQILLVQKLIKEYCLKLLTHKKITGHIFTQPPEQWMLLIKEVR